MLNFGCAKLHNEGTENKQCLHPTSSLCFKFIHLLYGLYALFVNGNKTVFMSWDTHRGKHFCFVLDRLRSRSWRKRKDVSRRMFDFKVNSRRTNLFVSAHKIYRRDSTGNWVETRTGLTNTGTIKKKSTGGDKSQRTTYLGIGTTTCMQSKKYTFM